MIDAGPFDTRNFFYSQRGNDPPPCRVAKDRWVQADICDPPGWPFENDFFDFVYCGMTIEDVRDPIVVCSEMNRVARAGLIVTVKPPIELTRGIDSRYTCGWRHHRWLVDAAGDEVVFVMKPHHIHDPRWRSVRTPKRLRADAFEPLEIRWEGELRAREELIYDAEELDQRLLALLEPYRLPDPAAQLWRAARNGYLAVRIVCRSAAAPWPVGHRVLRLSAHRGLSDKPNGRVLPCVLPLIVPGRVVIPKAVRDEPGIEGSAELEVAFRDGRIEIEPVSVPMRLAKHVVEAEAEMPSLTSEDVRDVPERTRR